MSESSVFKWRKILDDCINYKEKHKNTITAEQQRRLIDILPVFTFGEVESELFFKLSDDSFKKYDRNFLNNYKSPFKNFMILFKYGNRDFLVTVISGPSETNLDISFYSLVYNNEFTILTFSKVITTFNSVNDENGLYELKILATEHYEDLDLVEYRRLNESYIFTKTAIIVGFIIALATKGMLESKDVKINNGYRKVNGKKECIQKDSHKEITLSLLGKEHLEYLRTPQDNNRKDSRKHLRRGHYKQRKTGLYWWRPHFACKDSEYSVSKDYKVKA